MEARAQARRSLELDLRTALEKDAFDLLLSADLRHPHAPHPFLRGAAALASSTSAAWCRRRSSSRVAEEMGIIVEIGQQVLRKACLECRRWPGDTGVAVNLSSIQFSRSNVPALIRQTLAATGLPAEPAAHRDHRIDAVAGHAQVARGAAPAGNARRAGLARRLRNRLFEPELPAQLPAAQGEDRPVVPAGSGEHAPDDPAARRGAAQRGTRACASPSKGVETDEQLALIAGEASVDEVQGYLLGRPLPAADIRKLLDAMNADRRAGREGGVGAYVLHDATRPCVSNAGLRAIAYSLSDCSGSNPDEMRS